MIKRTYLSKCNTIKKGYPENYGLYPVCMLNYGGTVSRALISFDLSGITGFCDEYGNPEGKTRHILRMSNCGSVDRRRFSSPILPSDDYGLKRRADSFTLIFFEIPEKWDRGIGFDNSGDFWLTGEGAVSFGASNWYNRTNGTKWETEGIYTNARLEKEYAKFRDGEDSIVIAEQHFEHGNEDIEVDITDFIEKARKENREFNGIGIAFEPSTERIRIGISKYVGFFSDKTNTFFEPYVETRIDDPISDDRRHFYMGKDNRLYFYSEFGGVPEDLDETPKCTIEGTEYPVKRQRKGVYYADVRLGMDAYEDETILTDTWNGIRYQGEDIPDVDMEFVALSNRRFSHTGHASDRYQETTVTVLGIGHDEKVNKGERRKMKVLFKRPYTFGMFGWARKAEYRLYVSYGGREIDVIKWDSIDLMDDMNEFTIDTEDLLPNSDYRIDIRALVGNEEKYFKDELRFSVTNNDSYVRI